MQTKALLMIHSHSEQRIAHLSILYRPFCRLTRHISNYKTQFVSQW